MTRRVKLHDGVIGVVLLASTALTLWVDPRAVWLVGLTGGILLSSMFTGCCPVHFAVRKLTP
jgi:hypothetical protein